ncbi:transposase, partial [Rhodothermus sp. AH-315-K08]|nr:transposase [Rhodothermus sp. AH-315-K08]
MSEQDQVWMSENDLKLEERKETEVVPRAQRRRFSQKYKLRIVAEADGCRKPGEVGALLRREGIHSSTLGRWRKARAEGKLNPSSPAKRGPVASPDTVVLRENAKLRKNITRLERKLEQAELIIGVQKKVSLLLGIGFEETDHLEK